MTKLCVFQCLLLECLSDTVECLTHTVSSRRYCFYTRGNVATFPHFFTTLLRENLNATVIPLSLCKYTLFSKSENNLFLQPVHLRSTRTIITYRRYVMSLIYISKSNGPSTVPCGTPHAVVM